MDCAMTAYSDIKSADVNLLRISDRLYLICSYDINTFMSNQETPVRFGAFNQRTNTFLHMNSKHQAAGSCVGHSQSGWIFHTAADDAVNYRWQDKPESLASIRRGHEVSDLHADCQCLLHTTQGQWQWEGLGVEGRAGLQRLPLYSFLSPGKMLHGRAHTPPSAHTHSHQKNTKC